MTKKPIIGVIPDYVKSSKQSYSIRPHYSIRKNYLDMVTKSGGISLIIPYDYEAIDDYIDMIDGLMVIGGFFDINPNRYGNEEAHQETILNEIREDFEFKFSEKFLATKRPYFGICNGMQVMNCLKGGSIMQHIPDEEQDFMIHEQSKIEGKEDSSIPYHDVIIQKNTLLHDIVGKDVITTNSSHHQAARNIGPGIVVNSYASDGIIEGIEDPTHPFCLGVQWHPEFESCPEDKQLFDAFINITIAMKNDRQ